MSCYHLKNKIEIKSNKYLVETQLYTIDNQIALIKSVCFDNIFEELYEMFKTKYGEDIYAYPDETFFNIVTGAHVYLWSFANNGIILVYNNEQHDVYHTVYDYRKNLWYTYYTFKNITIVYCDKQLYRRLLQKENERKSSVEREQFVSDSLKKVEKYRKDSIQKANEKERLIRNSTQI